MKTKQEQIEDMAESVVSSAIVSNAKIDNKVAINLNKFVENMLRIGYRKATEVIDDFESRLSKSLACQTGKFGLADLKYVLDEMRKDMENG